MVAFPATILQVYRPHKLYQKHSPKVRTFRIAVSHCLCGMQNLAKNIMFWISFLRKKNGLQFVSASRACAIIKSEVNRSV